MKVWNLSDQESLQLAQKAGWSVAGLARERGVCVRTLERQFQANHKTSAKAWMKTLRWRLALQMLAEDVQPKLVATAVGYRHSSTFGREFKRRFGFCPAEFVCQPGFGKQFDLNVAKS